MPITFHVPDASLGGNDSNTLLLLHGDESPLVDSSISYGHSLNLSNANRSAAQSKFGGYSIDFTSDNEDIQIADHADFNIPTGDMTWDMWYRPSAISNGTNYYFFCQGDATGAYYLTGQLLGGAVTHVLAWQETWNNSLQWRDESSAITMNVGTWYHIAFVRSNDDFTIYLDGTSVSNVNASRTLNDQPYPMYIGRANYTPAPQRINGYLDEVRFSNVARWTTDFIPVGPYTE